MKPITFRDLIEFLFLPVLSAGVLVLWDINKNVNTLNVQVGVLIANNGTVQQRIETLEKRVEKIEDNQIQRGRK